jgi:hypothetical protein
MPAGEAALTDQLAAAAAKAKAAANRGRTKRAKRGYSPKGGKVYGSPRPDGGLNWCV